MKIALNAIRVSRKGGGGLDHYIINLVNQMAKMGVDFDLYTVAPHHFPHVNPRQIKNPIFVFGDFLRLLWTQFFLPFYLIFGKYDLLFSPSQIDALPWSPIPQLITVLDLIPFLFKEQKHKHTLFLKMLFPIALKRAAHILTISNNTQRDVENLFKIAPHKVTAVLLSIPQDIQRRERPSQEEIKITKIKYKLDRYIFCLSNNDPHKNLGRLIEAFGFIREKTSCHLAIAGYQNSVHQQRLVQAVRDFLLEERVTFLGHVPSEDLPALFYGCEIFVYPSLYEGFGLPPLEALSYGVPTLVSQSSSLPEVVGNAGLYFDPTNPADMAEKMEKLLTDENLRTELKDLGLKRAQIFSWDKTAQETLKVLKEALQLN